MSLFGQVYAVQVMPGALAIHFSVPLIDISSMARSQFMEDFVAIDDMAKPPNICVLVYTNDWKAV